MADFPPIFGMPSPEEVAMARANALRRRQEADQLRSIGALGQLTGDKVLAPVGKSFLGQAQGLEEQGLEADRASETQRQHVLTQAMQWIRDQESSKDRKGDNDRADRSLGIQEQRLALERSRAGKAGDADSDRKTKFSRETAEGLRKEILNNDVTKKAQEVATAYGKLKRVATGTASAAGDMSLVFSYMKMLDPGSTVREGEYANAQNAAGIPEKIRNIFNRAKDGQLLDPNQRTDFLNQAKTLADEQIGRYRAFSKPYTGLAQKYGLDPSEVVLDLGFDEAPKPGARPKLPALPSGDGARPGSADEEDRHHPRRPTSRRPWPTRR
jgi:hypothetical protein